MQIKANSPEAYLNQLAEDRKLAMEKLRKVILDNLPAGFKEEMSYGMIGYVVPHSIYPDGYHCDPKLPLPFMNIASQKNFVALYHSVIYADSDLNKWFVDQYPKHCKYKIDMGKSCIRFKKMEDIPYDLIAELTRKITPKQWIKIYEQNIRR